MAENNWFFSAVELGDALDPNDTFRLDCEHIQHCLISQKQNEIQEFKFDGHLFSAMKLYGLRMELAAFEKLLAYQKVAENMKD